LIQHKLRRDFLTAIGTMYDQYGYPEYCGWIEGLMLLEPQEWTQRGISSRLRELFPESKYPTSVPSVNRALKVLETYGVVQKTGSRRTGYQYQIATSTSFGISMLQQLILVNSNFITSMKGLLVRNKKKDPALRRAVNAEIKGMGVWNRALEKILDSLAGKSME
jgi:DNA-binding transcriptional regulator GbsR (MarR family)